MHLFPTNSYDKSMTILEYSPDRESMLPFIDEGIRQLREAGAEATYIVVGLESYKILRKAMGERFLRGAGRFETYHNIPIVLDPSRTDSVCVLPPPAECAKGVELCRI